MLNQIRIQVLALWGRASRVQRIVTLVLALTAVLLAVAFSWWASTPEYGVAYSGLADVDAGVIVEKLKAANIPYQLQSSGTILVPKTQVFDVRLSMAKDGLPQGGSVGFELFNSNSLGSTEFSQKVNYQRALEGELARTIEALSPVQVARVHIVVPEAALFADQQKPATASITLGLKAGQQLDPGQVQAITHLVASSVEGLTPEAVVVVDAGGQMLSANSRSGDAPGMNLSDEQRAVRRKFEADLEARVQDMLIQALGPERAIVRVSADLNWNKVETTEELFDPQGIVRSSAVISESYSGSAAQPGGIPGASSNLPAETAPTYPTTITNTTGAGYQRSEATTNYEIATTQTHIVVAPGGVERLSVSVLVDNITDTVMLGTLNEIVTLAAGADAARGDQVTVQSVAFDRTYFEQQAADMASESRMDLYLQIGTYAALAILLALLFWFFQRLVGNLRLRSGQDAWTQILRAAPRLAPPLAAAGAIASPRAGTERLAALAASLPDLPLAFEMPGQGQPELDRMQRTVTRLVEERPVAVAEIIHQWLEKDDRAG